MKKLLGLMAIAVLMGIGAALAQGTFGMILTSPVAVSGSLNYNAGTQVSGISATGGTFTCTSGGSIVVPGTAATANSIVLMSAKTFAGTGTAGPQVGSLTAGTGFTAKCATNDTSLYNYWILG